MKITFAHICDYAVISQEGKLSVLGMFQNINTAAVPTVHPTMFLVFELEFSRAEFNRDLKVSIVLQAADGAQIMKLDGNFRVDGQVPPGERPRMHQIVPIHGLNLPQLGGYQFSIFLNDSHAVDVGFTVMQITAAPGA